jgi:hypothetical protein
MRNHKFAGVAATLVALTLVVGCGPARATTTQPATGVFLQDDFSAPTSGWDSHTGADVTTNYDNGHYLIAVGQPGVDVWAKPGLDLTDVAVQVEAQSTAGPVNNEYGILCRYQRSGDGKNSFYFFFISTDGYYALGKVSKDTRKILSPAAGSFQASSAIKPAAVNVLAATCQGDRLSLTVNGTPVGEFNDSELTRGDIGLVAGTFDAGGVQIHFDNLIARQPP